MRLNFRKKTDPREKSRIKNKVRIRKKIEGTSERPRLCVFRGNKHIYAQLIDDVKGVTLAETSTLKLEGKSRSSCDAAKAVGEGIAKKAQEKKISKVVFDRNGFVYHGRIKALADAAREAGLKF